MVCRRLLTGILVVSLIVLMSAQPFQASLTLSMHSTHLNNIRAVNPDISTDQSEVVKTSDLLRGAFDILETRWKESRNLITLQKNDQNVYYGQAGGLAGIGQAILDLLNSNSNFVNQDTRTRMEAMALQIGDELNETGFVNGTHNKWTVSNSSDLVELSWDFGIAGISSYFVDLYAYFNVSEFLTIAQSGLRYIADYVNATGDWKSYLIDVLRNSYWYPDLEYEMLFPPGTTNATFTGRALGITGIAQSALNYLRYGNDSDPMVHNLLNQSIEHLNSQLNYDGSMVYVNNSLEGLPSVSMNQATGVSGIGEFYLDMYQYSGNNTYLDFAQDIAHFLAGTDDEVAKYAHTWIRNGTLVGDRIEFGQEHGVAGNIEYLLHLAEISGNTTYAFYAKTAVDILLGYTTQSGDQITIGDRYVVDKQLPNAETNSWSYGGGGVFAAIYDLGKYYKSSIYLEQAEMMKNYLRTTTMEVGGKTALYTIETGSLENNPSFGLPDTFRFLIKTSRGQLSVEQDSLDFGEVVEGLIQTKTITIRNIGEAPLTTSWSNLGSSSPFRTQNFSAIIGELDSYKLPVEFRSTGEQDYEATLQIFGDENTFNITLTARSYNFPTLELIEGLSNGTIIDSKDPISFVINATDVSGIVDVDASVTGPSNTGFTLNPIAGTTLFNNTWTPDLNNGTYTLTITATDSLAYSTSITLTFEVGIYTTPLEEQIFSSTTIGILVGAAVVMLGVAIFVTRRYMN